MVHYIQYNTSHNSPLRDQRSAVLVSRHKMTHTLHRMIWSHYIMTVYDMRNIVSIAVFTNENNINLDIQNHIHKIM